MTLDPRANLEPQPPPPRPVAGSVRILNLRLLLVSAIIVVVVGGFLSRFHAWQLDRHSKSLLGLAAEAEEANEWSQAGEWLHQYVRLHPDDAEAKLRLAIAIEKSAPNPAALYPAIDLLAGALHEHPERQDIRVLLAGLLLDIDSFEAALQHAEDALQAQPRNPQALLVRAKALDHLRSSAFDGMAEITRAYEDAHEYLPGEIQPALRLAVLYRRHGEELAKSDSFVRPEQLADRADRIVNQLVEAAKQPASALVARHEYRRQFGLSELRTDGELEPDIKRALELAPDSVIVRLRAAESMLGVRFASLILRPLELPAPGAEGLKIAREHLVAAKRLGENPSRPQSPGVWRRTYDLAVYDLESNLNQAYLGLALIEMFHGRHADAIQTIKDGLKATQRLDPALNCLHASLALALQEWDEALAPMDSIETLVRNVRATQRGDEADELAAVAQLLRANWLMAAANPSRSLLKAADHLSTVTRLADRTPLAKESYEMLAEGRMALGQWDLAASAFQRAATLELKPETRGALRLRAADALLRANRANDAVRQYRQSLLSASDDDQRLSAAAGLATALTRVQTLLPEDKRDLQPFEEALELFESIRPGSPIPVILRLQATVFLKSREDAIREVSEALHSAGETYADSPEFWKGACELSLALGLFDDAERALEKLQTMPAARGVSLLTARVLSAKGKPEEALAYAETAVNELRGAERQKALEFRNRLPGWNPDGEGDGADASHDIEIVSRQFAAAQAAIARQDLRTIRQCEDRLRTVEGNSGSFWRYVAIHRLILEASRGDAADELDEAVDQTTELLTRRPGWPMGHLAQARVHEARGRLTDAIGSYRDTMRFGASNPMVIGRLGSLLLLNNRRRELQDMLSRMPERLRATPEVSALAVELALSDPEYRVSDAVLAAGDDAESIVRRSRIALGSESPQQHSQALPLADAAVARDPADLAVWLYRLHAYLSVAPDEHELEILDTLRRIKALLEIDDSENADDDGLADWRKAFVIARGFQLSGEHEAADTYYRHAERDARSTEGRLLPLPAGAIVSRSLRSPDASLRTSRLRYASNAPRNLLGLVLASRANADDRRDGEELLADNDRLRMIAALASGDVSRSRQTREILESQVRESSEPARSDLRLLSNLRLLEGDLQGAADALRPLLQSEEPIPARDWQTFARATTAFREEADALLALERLDDLDLSEAEAARAKTLLLNAAGRTGDAAAEAVRYASDAGERLQRAMAAAAWLDEIDRPDDGTRLLQDLRESGPAGGLPLAEHLGRRTETIGAALQICEEEARRRNDNGPAWMAASILLHEHAGSEHEHRAGELIRKVQSEHSGPYDLDSVMILLKEKQGDVESAIALCRKAVTRSPNNPGYLNNLAWLLAGYGGDGEMKTALEAIDRAISLAGPQDALLDTKATVLLRLKRTNAAVALLQTCASAPEASGTIFLHLADAYRSAEQTQLSAQTLRLARRLGLNSLTPADRKRLQSLPLD